MGGTWTSFRALERVGVPCLASHRPDLAQGNGLDKPATTAQACAIMARFKPRIAARALILHQDRLLLVNAYPKARLGLWCAPGGGCEAGQSLPQNLAREVHEETGLAITVGAPVLVNEFHDPDSGFHQIDLFFRCTLLGGGLSADWIDPEGVVTERRFFSHADLASGTIRFKPDSLPAAAWGDAKALYDPLEVILK
jgi:8-oxo-dGTP diphosphatase